MMSAKITILFWLSKVQPMAETLKIFDESNILSGLVIIVISALFVRWIFSPKIKISACFSIDAKYLEFSSISQRSWMHFPCGEVYMSLYFPQGFLPSDRVYYIAFPESWKEVRMDEMNFNEFLKIKTIQHQNMYPKRGVPLLRVYGTFQSLEIPKIHYHCSTKYGTYPKTLDKLTVLHFRKLPTVEDSCA